ncbi:MAG: SH3 domain-containing protein [Candidatus Binataceae bacterium]|jgi:hypothetical protein
MKFSKTIATASIILLFTSARVLAEESPVPISSAATPAAAATSAAELKPVKKRFLLSHSSSVYQQPDKTSAVIAHVRRRTHVNVTGITGDWLQIRLPKGKIGFIPSSAAE